MAADPLAAGARIVNSEVTTQRKRVMKALIVTLALLAPALVTPLAAPPALAQQDRPLHRPDFDRGLAAWNAEDYAAAIAEWEELAAAGHPAAQFGLGLAHDFGRGVPEDHGIAVRWFARAAAQGHAGAQLFLAESLNTGRGLAADPEAAHRWFLAAARQGIPRAQNNLGRLYEMGRGTAADRDIALYWYEEAARQGFEKAILNRDRLLGDLKPALPKR